MFLLQVMGLLEVVTSNAGAKADLKAKAKPNEGRAQPASSDAPVLEAAPAAGTPPAPSGAEAERPLAWLILLYIRKLQDLMSRAVLLVLRRRIWDFFPVRSSMHLLFSPISLSQSFGICASSLHRKGEYHGPF